MSFKQPGHTVTLIAPSGDVAVGVGYVIGALFVVAMATAAEGLPFAGMVDGVHELAKATGEAWTAGQRIYWDDGDKVATSDDHSSTCPLIGVAMAIVGSSVAVGEVRLNGVAQA